VSQHVRCVHDLCWLTVSFDFILRKPLLHTLADEVLGLCRQSVEDLLYHHSGLVLRRTTTLNCMQNAASVLNVRNGLNGLF
jgi:hypothetical protein